MALILVPVKLTIEIGVWSWSIQAHIWQKSKNLGDNCHPKLFIIQLGQ